VCVCVYIYITILLVIASHVYLSVMYICISSVRSQVQGKKIVFLGSDRACGLTEVSSMNRNSNDLLANYD
jgi:hypothetical protein